MFNSGSHAPFLLDLVIKVGNEEIGKFDKVLHTILTINDTTQNNTFFSLSLSKGILEGLNTVFLFLQRRVHQSLIELCLVLFLLTLLSERYHVFVAYVDY